MSIKAKPIFARLITAKKITARLIQTFSKICRYFSTFDGSSSYAALTDDIVLSGDFEIEVDFSTTSSVTNTYLTDSDVSTSYIRFNTNGSVRLRIVGDTTTTTSSLAGYNDGSTHKLKCSVVSGIQTIQIDDDAPVSTTVANNHSFGISGLGVKFGAYFDGQLSDLKIWSGGDRTTGDLILDLPMSEGLKDVYDEVFYRNRVQTQAEWLLNLDGGYVELQPIVLSGDFEIEFKINPNSFSGVQPFLGSNNGIDNFIGTFNSDKLFYRFDANSTQTNLSFLINQSNTLTIKKVGSSVVSKLNGNSETDTNTGAFVIDVIGARNSSLNLFNGQLSDLKIWDGGDRTTGALIIDSALNDNSNIIANAASPVNANVWSGTVTAMGESSGDINSVNVLSTAGASSQVSVPATVAGEDVLIELTLSAGSLDNIIAGDSTTEFAGWSNIKDERGRETNRYETIMHNDNNEVVFKVSGVADATLTDITAKVVEGYGVLQGTQNTDFNWVLNKQPWWLLNLDGGYSAHQRLWNPDATDPSFSLEAYFDADVDGTIVAQNVSATGSSREFQLFTLGGAVRFFLGGTDLRIAATGAGLYRADFDGSNYTLFKDGTQVGSIAASIGTAREPTADFRIGARNSGSGGAAFTYNDTIKDVKFWINGTKSTGDLVLDSALDDNSNIIANAASPVNANVWSGTVTATGESSGDINSVNILSTAGASSQVSVPALVAGDDVLIELTLSAGSLDNIVAGDSSTEFTGWQNIRDSYGQPTNRYQTLMNNNDNEIVLKVSGIADATFTNITARVVEGYGVLQGTRNTDYEWKNDTPHAIGYNVETNEVCTSDGTNWVDSDLWIDGDPFID